MASFDVYVFCNECSSPHPMGIRIERDDIDVDKTTIGDLYAGRELPPEMARLVSNWTVCPNTRKRIRQADNNQVFLVAVRE